MVRWTSGYFGGRGVDSPRSEAEILLAHTLGMRRIDLYLNHDKPLSEVERKRFKAAIKRRVNGEPVAYITGSREFWSLELAVDPSVLIPRPETECLVEVVLPFLENSTGSPQRVLDMGTGSGAIVIALAHEHPEHRYIAMDRSAAALQTARKNARRHHVDHCIDWFCGSWNAALASDRAVFDLVVANPPYIRSGDMDGLPPEIRNHEPAGALDGSDDGLECLRAIIDAAHLHLKPRGRLALEIGFDQAADVQSFASGNGRYQPPRVLKDYSGLDRVVLMEKSPCGS
jgi:release factor glutamine methyltransferase